LEVSVEVFLVLTGPGTDRVDVQFLTTALEVQFSSQTFAHMLRALGSIPSTTQKEENYWEDLVFSVWIGWYILYSGRSK
jgi:hypothetical protein